MKTFINKYRLQILGVLVGAIAGWCYWYFVGCASGSCPITSKPVNSSLYGALVGVMLFSAFRNEKISTTNK